MDTEEEINYDLTPFERFYLRVSGRPPVELLPNCTLALDPGETTGVAIFTKLKLAAAYQENTSTLLIGSRALHKLIDDLKDVFPDLQIVSESYRIYSWRTKQHTWASLHTPRLIGALECLCYQYNVHLEQQSAQIGKGFVTDDRLKEWEFYQTGMQHARDATRHGCQWLLFGNTQHAKRTTPR